MTHDLVHIRNRGVELGGNRILAGVDAGMDSGASAGMPPDSTWCWPWPPPAANWG